MSKISQCPNVITFHCPLFQGGTLPPHSFHMHCPLSPVQDLSWDAATVHLPFRFPALTLHHHSVHHQPTCQPEHIHDRPDLRTENRSNISFYPDPGMSLSFPQCSLIYTAFPIVDTMRHTLRKGELDRTARTTKDRPTVAVTNQSQPLPTLVIVLCTVKTCIKQLFTLSLSIAQK